MAEQGKYLALLQERQPDLEKNIAPYFRAEQWILNARAAWNIIRASKELSSCNERDLVACVFEAARRGLEIGGNSKHCGIVPFKLKSGSYVPVLITQWQGKAFIWMKSGSIKKLQTGIVYKGDRIEVIGGDDDRIIHVPDILADHKPEWLNDLKNIVGAYAIATLWSGEKVHAFVTASQIARTMEAVKRRNDGNLGFGWKDWLPEMAQKTAVHRLEGKIQPPPDMTPEQIDAWARASSAPTSIEAEYTQVELPPDNIPDDDDKLSLVADGANTKQGEREANSPAPSATLTAQDQTRVLSLMKRNGIEPGMLDDLLRKPPFNQTGEYPDISLVERIHLKTLLEGLGE